MEVPPTGTYATVTRVIDAGLMGQGWSTTAGRYPERRRYTFLEMSNPYPQPSDAGSLELPVDELLTRGRPLPPHDEMVIDDLLPDEGAAFLATLKA